MARNVDGPLPSLSGGARADVAELFRKARRELTPAVEAYLGKTKRELRATLLYAGPLMRRVLSAARGPKLGRAKEQDLRSIIARGWEINGGRGVDSELSALMEKLEAWAGIRTVGRPNSFTLDVAKEAKQRLFDDFGLSDRLASRTLEVVCRDAGTPYAEKTLLGIPILKNR